ncbi:2OG-Fe(II) oxygenase [Nannocystis sp. ILAH1]|uniref:prolyl hydroxylase family protein n=1 Tax=unclassified Nannocystis TaxID=2627009 RepID=UPI00226DBEB3|nr:2OG-Fe(II) oxygenase [Nannocystis sp. ILAH1]MCY1063408.1 2OG-Fe(II) oxygenase [Nannocystis sp. RBIL2]
MYHRSLDLSHPPVWTVDDVLTASECVALIDRIESLGPVRAPVTMLRAPVLRPELRTNKRVIIDDPELAALLFERARPAVPPQIGAMTVLGVHERLRCYRYDPGERFAPHFDSACVRADDERSLLTFMVYLNEDFTGGETHFLHLEQTVVPHTGLGVLFQHRHLHEVRAVVTGRKYAVRCDILYKGPRAPREGSSP